MPAVYEPVPLPPLKDLTDDNITENTIIVNNQSSSPRLRYLFARLVTHLHDFARETRLSSEEWDAAIQFLTATGQICTDTRQEFILLSDVLGLSCLVDVMNHPKPAGATNGTVLGPFHTHDALEYEQGESICSEGKGEPCLVRITVKDTQGRPVVGVTVDIWETDDTGHYDTQYADRAGPDCRGVLVSDAEGVIVFKAIRPVPYPIPHDGPVGGLLEKLGRHPYRPSHMHFKFDKPGYDELVTSLYIRGDPYETTDAVFGVKSSLILDLAKIEDAAVAKEHGLSTDDWLLEYNFVLVTDEEAKELKVKNAEKALKKLGVTATVVDGLPIDALD
ncbi:Intradiol ring-cleavage dioxygenase [Kockiozyma suomiensis]|uniref:Intradiol ring-cleavage dioxygenase n=1 Tax=Kockiozyma suomiensis TaxID=1337062 RepID=UPI003343AE55